MSLMVVIQTAFLAASSAMEYSHIGMYLAGDRDNHNNSEIEHCLKNVVDVLRF